MIIKGRSPMFKEIEAVYKKYGFKLKGFKDEKHNTEGLGRGHQVTFVYDEIYYIRSESDE